MMGGCMWVESQGAIGGRPPEHFIASQNLSGSTFYFTFCASSAEFVPPVSIEPSENLEMRSQPLRILLAEDNVVNQKVALHLLARLGYRADIAGNGLEVLAALERQVYDVILMDVQMPEMDGLEATRKIVSGAFLYQPCIIAMTANAMEGDRQLCLDAGMKDYLSKPIRIDALKFVLSKCSPVVRSSSSFSNADRIESPPSLIRSDLSTVAFVDRALLLRDFTHDCGSSLSPDLIDRYLYNASLWIDQIQRFADPIALECLHSAVSLMRSSSLEIGAISLVESCDALETCLSLGTLEQVAFRVRQLEAEYDRVQASLHLELQQCQR
jgi:CheY-like chemotaxis protein